MKKLHHPELRITIDKKAKEAIKPMEMRFLLHGNFVHILVEQLFVFVEWIASLLVLLRFVAELNQLVHFDIRDAFAIC